MRSVLLTSRKKNPPLFAFSLNTLNKNTSLWMLHVFIFFIPSYIYSEKQLVCKRFLEFQACPSAEQNSFWAKLSIPLFLRHHLNSNVIQKLNRSNAARYLLILVNYIQGQKNDLHDWKFLQEEVVSYISMSSYKLSFEPSTTSAACSVMTSWNIFILAFKMSAFLAGSVKCLHF